MLRSKIMEKYEQKKGKKEEGRKENYDDGGSI